MNSNFPQEPPAGDFLREDGSYAPANSVDTEPSLSDRKDATLAHMDEEQRSSPEKRRKGKGFTIGATAVGALMILSPTARDIAHQTVVNMYESLTDTADSNTGDGGAIDGSLAEKTSVVTLPENHGDMVVEVGPPPVPTAPAP